MKFHILDNILDNIVESNELTVDGKEIKVETIYYDTGEKLYSYSYYFSDEDGTRIKHGPFEAYYRSSKIASKGSYEHGAEHGLWRDYHENGQLAAQGYYVHGTQSAGWLFWDEDGSFQAGS